MSNFESRLERAWNDDIVILCVGSSKVVGDSIGPRVGSALLHNDNFSKPVYGTMQNPVHSFNLDSTVEFIKVKHPNSLILAIDATISDKYREGSLYFSEDGIKPGKGINKDLIKVGDMSIKAVVIRVNDFKQTDSKDLVKQLHNISEGFVDKLVKRIVGAIIKASQKQLNETLWISKVIGTCNDKGLKILNLNFEDRVVRVQRGKLIKDIKV